jgi:hypothetical protein
LRVFDLVGDSFSDIVTQWRFHIAGSVTIKSNVALFGFQLKIDGRCAPRTAAGVRWAQFSLPPRDDKASFMTDV